jgi:hypothetical protein
MRAGMRGAHRGTRATPGERARSPRTRGRARARGLRGRRGRWGAQARLQGPPGHAQGGRAGEEGRGGERGIG